MQTAWKAAAADARGLYSDTRRAVWPHKASTVLRACIAHTHHAAHAGHEHTQIPHAKLLMACKLMAAGLDGLQSYRWLDDVIFVWGQGTPPLRN